MDWPGKREDQSIYGQGALTCTNVLFRREDSIGRRPGRTGKLSTNGRSVCEFSDPINGRFLVLHKDTTVHTVNLSTGSVYTVTTAYANRDANLAKCQGRVYLANGFDPMGVLEDATSTMGTAGISASTTQIGAGAQASGSMTDGTHLFRYRYFNSKTGYYSNPSPARSITLSGNKKVTFTVGTDMVASSDARVDKIIVESTLAYGTEFYRAQTCNNTASATAVVSISDLDLQLQQILDYGLGNDPPPAFSIIAEHRGRLWGIGFPATVSSGTVASGSNSVVGTGFSTKWAGKSMLVSGETTRYTLASSSAASGFVLETEYQGASGVAGFTIFDPSEDALYWSSPTLPEGWDTINQYRRVLQNQSDTPSALMSNGEDLLVFGQRTVRRLTYNLDPAKATLDNLPTDNGCYNQRCIVQVDGTNMGFGRNGIWAMRGLLPKIISQPVADTLDGADPAYLSKFHAAWDPYLRVAIFFYVVSGDTEPKQAVALDLDTGRWSVWSWPCGIIGSVTAADDAGLMRLYLSDINGYTWVSNADEVDGVENGFDRVVTADTGSTNTVVNVTGLLQTSPNLVGVYVYRPDTGEEKLISANTSGQLTCAAFATSVAAGEKLWLGRIPVVYRTKWIRQDALSKERVTELALEFTPDSDGCEIGVSIFIDGNASATAFAKGSDDVDTRGVTLTDGDAEAVVTTDSATVPEGRASIPVPTPWHRTASFQITNSNPQGDLEIVSLQPGLKPGKMGVE